MTEYEILDLIGSQVATVDRVFEFWLTATFAVIVAAHFAGNSLSRYTTLLIGFLYVCTSAFLAYRYAMTVSSTLALTEEIGQMGIRRVPELIVDLAPSFAALRILIFTIGVGGTLHYLFRGRTNAAPT